MKEELYWKQRAKLFWLKEGDENTRFFHASASARKKANHISFLENENGVREDNPEAMCNIVKDYFVKIFGESERRAQNNGVVSPRVVSEEQNNKLTAEFTFEEFTMAIKQMHPDKASGPDGLNPAFYQNFWTIMGNEVFECCKGWLRGNPFPADLNSTNVVLILKKDNAASMKDFRPITLCNVLY